MIEAQTIKSSIAKDSPRLVTMRCISPKFIHQESLRHRKIYFHDLLGQDPDFSFSVSSARAIPFFKLLEEVRSDGLRASPVVWGCEQKGMQSGDELSPAAEATAKFWWREAALRAADIAESMSRAEGLESAMPWDIPHKSIINRIIEPYIHVHALMTATEPGWMNFFGLRLDQAADKTLQALAKACWKEWNEAEIQVLEPGEWHLPFIQNYPEDNWLDFVEKACQLEIDTFELVRKISAARCARLSYNSFSTNKRSTIEEDLELYNRLVGSMPLHCSSLEHIATPDTVYMNPLSPDVPAFNMITNDYCWQNPHQHGNLKGWRQFRKMIPNEEIAPLPKEYQIEIR